MSNTFITPTAVAREALKVLHTNCQFIKNCDKSHDKDVEIGGMKRGASLKIKAPAQYSVRSDWNINLQETTETYDTLTVATVRGVDIFFTEADRSQNIDSFSKQFIEPAVARLAAEIDYITFNNSIPYIYNLVGTYGTTPAAASTYLDAGKRLSHCLAPVPERVVIVNPDAEAATVGAHIALFNPANTISKQFKDGQMGRALGFDWYMSQNVPSLTTGSRATSTNFQVNATVSSEGSESIAIKGLSGATQTLAAGDVFTVASVYAVNPETKQTLGYLQPFVCTAAADGSGSVVTATVRPKMYTSASGGLQTVSAFPLQDAVVTFLTGAASTVYPQNIAMRPEAVTFATANLELPKGVDFAAREVMDGISLRIVRDYNINDSSYPCRIDILCGSLVQRPSFACRITG